MTKYPRDLGDRLRNKAQYKRHIAYTPQQPSEPIYERPVDYHSSEPVSSYPRHINYSSTPLTKTPQRQPAKPTAYRLIIRLPPKPIDPVPIVELLHLFLSTDQTITLQLTESPT